jgi:hypothetical protein
MQVHAIGIDLGKTTFQGRSAYKNRHAQNSSWPREETLQPKAGYIDAHCSFVPQLFPCNQAADHTFSDR